jgi:hypothetical protein
MTNEELNAIHVREFREISTGGGLTALYSEIEPATEIYFLVTSEGAFDLHHAPKSYAEPCMLGYHEEGELVWYREFASYGALLEWMDGAELVLPTDDATGWTRV